MRFKWNASTLELNVGEIAIQLGCCVPRRSVIGRVGRYRHHKLRLMLDSASPSAVARLAELFAARGEAQELRDLGDIGGRRAVIASARLVELLVKQGNEDELRGRMDAGDLDASVERPNLLTEHGRAEEAYRLRRFGLTADDSAAGRSP
jgi:hypothetical protein